MVDSLPTVHLFSADSHVLARWRQSLGGIAPVMLHRQWQPAADLGPVLLSLVDLRVPNLPALRPEDWDAESLSPRIACSAEPHTREGLLALRCGFRGYCHWDIGHVLWPRMINAMRHGELWLGRSLLNGCALALADAQPPMAPHQLWQSTLTPREREVALLVAEGESNKVVARRLGLSERTVKDHLTHIFAKLDLHDRVQLALAVHGVSTHHGDSPLVR